MSLSKIQVFRTICRVDYPVTFAEIDRLGAHTQTLQERTMVAPYAGVQNNLNVATHSATSHGKVDGRPFTFTLGPKNVNFSVEYPDGLSVDRISDTKLFELLAEMLPKMAPKHVYERVGVRSLILASGPSLKFRRVLDVLMSQLGVFREPLTNGMTPADVAFVVETNDKRAHHGRFAFGPYRAPEWVKYFDHEPVPPIEEGAIFDVDTSIIKVELPGFDLRKFTKAHQLMITEGASGILRRLEGVLN